MKYPIRLLSGLLLSALLLFVSCSDDNPASPNLDTPPEVPSVHSMKMDMSIFDQQGMQADAAKATTNSHFQAAYLQAIFAKLIVDVQLAFPRGLLSIADDVEPELNEDGEWVWSFSSQHGEDTFGVKLIAQSKDGGIYWAFTLSSSVLNMDKELFFDGITKNNGLQGTWYYYGLFNAEYESNEAATRLEWLIENENNVSLTLTVLNNLSHGSKGDQIDYTKEGVIKTLSIYNANQDETIIISWNADTKVGYIIAPDYNNGEKACWNSSFENTPCAEIEF